MKGFKELAQNKSYEIRTYNEPLKAGESFDKVKTPFDLSNENGGTVDGFKYYNTHYLYFINSKV